MTDAERADWLRQLAVAHGFPQVAIAPVGPVPRHEVFRDWIAADRCGDMDFLRRDADARRDPRQLLEIAVEGLPGPPRLAGIEMQAAVAELEIRGTLSQPGAAIGALGHIRADFRPA